MPPAAADRMTIRGDSSAASWWRPSEDVAYLGAAVIRRAPMVEGGAMAAKARVTSGLTLTLDERLVLPPSPRAGLSARLPSVKRTRSGRAGA
jgi:hypothetical protein